VRQLLKSANQGNPVARAFRECGIRTGRLVDLPPAARIAAVESESVQNFQKVTGLRHVLATRLFTPSEELGRVVFFRAVDEPEFEDRYVFMLEELRPTLMQAARTVLCRHAESTTDDEVAIVDPSARIIYQTRSFRFLWGAVAAGKSTGTKLNLPALLASPTWFHTQVASRIIVLGLPEPPQMRTVGVRVPYSTGTGELTALLSKVSGELYSYRGDLLRIALRRDDHDSVASDRTERSAPTTPHAT
jgi:hypothetical protein